MEYINNSFDYAVPHSAFILTKSNSIEQFKSSKILVPYKQSKITKNNERIEPWELEIHPTNKCPLKCKGCSYKTRKNNDEINLEHLDKYIRNLDWSKINSLFFSGGGDPLYWKHWDYINSIKQEGVLNDTPIGIATNMIGFKELDYIDLFDFYQIHIVGFDRQSCINEVGVDCFELLYENLKLLMEHRHNKNIALKFLINNDSIKYLDSYLDFINQFDINTIVIKIEQNFICNDDKCRINNSTVIENQICNHSISKKFDFLINNLEDTLWDKTQPRECYICNSRIYSLIRANGDIFPCVASTYDEKNAIGNISGKIYIKVNYNDLMRNHQCPTKACRHYRFNKIIDLYNNGQTFEETIPVLI